MDWVLIGKPSEYTYSDTIYVRKWAGGYISVKVGYVKKHPEKNQIVLEKIWPEKDDKTGRQTFNIKGKDDWEALRTAIEKLWPEIEQEPSKEIIDKAIKKVSQDTDLLKLISKYPQLLDQTKDVDILLLPPEEKEALSQLLSKGSQIAINIVEKLANQPIKDIEDLSNILNNLKLSTINSLVTHVTSRISFIELFEKVIHDDNSYERKGADSVHNLLKANIWLVDRNFSILNDDVTLKTILEKQWGSEISDVDGNSRPDFLCMTDPISEKYGQKKLFIIEIKRPKIKIKMDHIEQVMGYRSVLEKYSHKKFDYFQCFVIGRELDEKLRANSLSGSGFVTKTYTDFISDSREFYKEYLKIIQKGDRAF